MTELGSWSSRSGKALWSWSCCRLIGAGRRWRDLARDDDRSVVDIWAELFEQEVDAVFWSDDLARATVPLLVKTCVEPVLPTGELVTDAAAATTSRTGFGPSMTAAARASTNPVSTSVSTSASSSAVAGTRDSRRSRTAARLKPTTPRLRRSHTMIGTDDKASGNLKSRQQAEPQVLTHANAQVLARNDDRRCSAQTRNPEVICQTAGFCPKAKMSS